MGDLIEIKRRVQFVCPECECEFWLAYEEGWECSECGYSEKDFDNRKKK